MSDTSDSFDIQNIPPEERESFFEDLGDLVMKKIFLKAWTELPGPKKQQLTDLIEASDMNPDDVAKQEAIFTFLEKNIPNMEEYIAQEVEEIQATYEEYQDELLDAPVSQS